MFPKNKLHDGFLATISIGITLVTVYAIANPHVGNRQVADFEFPHEILLGNWQQLSSDSLAVPTKLDEHKESIKSAQRYSYRKDELNLVVEIRYLVGTRGNIANLWAEYFPLSPAIIARKRIKNITGIGSYLLVEVDNSKQQHEQQKASVSYLSSCLTPLGYSIAEQKEFTKVLNRVGLTPQLLWNWLWGTVSIRDRRCLWLNLAITTHNQDLAHSQEDLEQAWLELNRWWKPRFPQLY